ncbi:hypothetical protein CEXT_656161 [Caerostris extrusa]|uniref:Uncharacterized protein n=1 Tax=Caerostris extrusa TaxID=172846 RepID=A0AAV4MZV1_CAEEX|nr:hypothetical protein CEXT_656161 [Caerostris extrusa]
MSAQVLISSSKKPNRDSPSSPPKARLVRWVIGRVGPREGNLPLGTNFSKSSNTGGGPTDILCPSETIP